MKIKDIRVLKEVDANKKLVELKKELFNLRFQKPTGQLTNLSRVKYVRRSIAKLMTVMNEKNRSAGDKNA